MSIVADALKKVQKQRAHTAVQASRVHVYRGSRSPGPVFIIIVFFILTALIVMAILYVYNAGIVRKNTPIAVREMKKVTGPDIDQEQSSAEEITTQDGRKGADNVYGEYDRLAPAVTAPSVSGIMYDSSDPKAIINGKIVRKGSSVNGFLVTDILPDGVSVKRDDEEMFLRIE